MGMFAVHDDDNVKITIIINTKSNQHQRWDLGSTFFWVYEMID